MLARIYLGFSAIVFISLGLMLMIDPKALLDGVEVRFDSPTAWADIRADYGGCIIGLGTFLAYCVLKRHRVCLGLLCTGLVFCGYASGRILSLIVDGAPKQIIYILLTVELAGAVIAFALIPNAKGISTELASKPVD